MNAAHLEVPISHYDSFPWISWIFLKSTENLTTLVWQYYHLWWSYITYFVKVNARIATTIIISYLLRQDIISAVSYMIGILHSAARLLRARSTDRQTRDTYIERSTRSLTRLSHSFPKVIGLIVLLSGIIPGAVGHPASPTHGFGMDVSIAGIQHVDLPARGANYNPYDAIAISQQVDMDEPSTLSHTALLREQMAFLVGSSNPISKRPPPKDISSFPLFHAALDSGCTGSCTGYLDCLVNVRPCKEVYAQANGRLSHCHWKGDMPVFVKTGTNTIVSINITNVRYVPDFKYTLLSVKQLWREQHIDARFRDLNHLELPSGGITIPYNVTSDLPTIFLQGSI